MNITQLKTIFEVIPTYTSSTINTFQTGKNYEFPSDGDNIYPLLYLEEDYIFNQDKASEKWTFALLVLSHLDQDNLKQTKDILRDDLLDESRKVVNHLSIALKDKEYQGSIESVSYLSLLDFESDNLQGWRIELTINVVNKTNLCYVYS